MDFDLDIQPICPEGESLYLNNIPGNFVENPFHPLFSYFIHTQTDGNESDTLFLSSAGLRGDPMITAIHPAT